MRATSDRLPISSIVAWSAVTLTVFVIQNGLNDALRVRRNDFRPACEADALVVRPA